jgi:Rrf2 family protein
MRISAKAEYACIAMLELVANHGEQQPVRVKTIADHHDIPLRFLMQTLLQLKTGGLVVSVRGAAGGYQLARPPEAISLADVITAIDGPVAPPSVSNPSSTLNALRGIWHEVQTEEQRMLEDISLADLVRRTQQKSVLSYQI